MPTARKALVTGLLVVLYSAATAHAHKPAAIGGSYPTFDQALWVTDIDVSQVAYAELTDGDRALWLAFDAAAGTRLDLSLGVPVIDRLTDYRPSIAILGPGLPAIELPIETPPGSGGVIFDSAGREPEFFHEPFTGTDSWILVEEAVDLPETGTYYVVAWPPGVIVDKLWVAIGVREEFGISDVLSLPTIIRDVREFHEAVPRAGHSATFGKLLFLALAAAMITLLVSRSRR
jgi:hypothetical protein